MSAAGVFELGYHSLEPIQVELSQHRQRLAQIQGASLLKTKFSIIFGIDLIKKYLLLFFLTLCISSFALEESSIFLPETHSAKKKLDHIFKKGRPFASAQALKKADFYVLHWRGGQHAYVVRHPALKGYILKVVLDDQGVGDGLENFSKRVIGARQIASYIVEKRLNHFFKAPEKWVYELPKEGKTGEVKYLLIAKDMKPLPHSKNRNEWRSRDFGKDRLEALYLIIKTLGLFDSVYIDNIPFCEDGKMAFLDTEHYGRETINFAKLTRMFHPTNQILWTKLTKLYRK